MDSSELIQQYLLGSLDAEGVAELDRRLKSDAALRREFQLATQVDAALRENSLELSIEQEQSLTPAGADADRAGGRNGIRWAALALVAIAASMLIAIAIWPTRPDIIASIQESEGAAWESVLPTNPGSELPAGMLNLKAGIALIRFRSGAELVMEAPASIELLTDMRAKLHSGAAVMDVPESAEGFVLETPRGYAVDFGTRFAVQVDASESECHFELLDGEIALHHQSGDSMLRLSEQGATARISEETVETTIDQQQELGTEEREGRFNVIRIRCADRNGTSMAFPRKREKYVNPEVLIVKKSRSGRWDYRSFFGFDVSKVDLQQVQDARIRLNLVPSDRGVASRLPKVNRFSVYGLSAQRSIDWESDFAWDAMPGTDDGVLLGTFEIKRSERRGTFGVSGETLLRYLQSNPENAKFLLVRETTSVEGVGVGMPHMFASSEHPESVGPMLELEMNGAITP